MAVARVVRTSCEAQSIDALFSHDRAVIGVGFVLDPGDQAGVGEAAVWKLDLSAAVGL